MILRITGALAAAVLVASAAPAHYGHDHANEPASAKGRQCFYLSQVDGYTHVKGSRDRIRVSTGPRDKYEFEVFGFLPPSQ